MTIEALLSRLEGVRDYGTSWVACCPAHDDQRPSLSVARGNDGRVLLYCHAGCSFGEICNALDFEPKDLGPHE